MVYVDSLFGVVLYPPLMLLSFTWVDHVAHSLSIHSYTVSVHVEFVKVKHALSC